MNKRAGFVAASLPLALCFLSCNGEFSAGDGTADDGPDQDPPVEDMVMEDGPADTGEDLRDLDAEAVDVPIEDDPCAGHCSNGISDCGETGVDCGGGCPACGRLAVRGNWLGMVGQDGLWRVAIPCGMVYGSNWYDASHLDTVAAAGKNLIYAWAGAGFYGETSAYLFTNGDLSQGFDDAAWAALEQMLQNAAARDMGVLLALWDTTGLEGDRSTYPETPQRWDVNPWNAAVGRGGPYDLPGCGKAAFVEIPSLDAFLYDPADSYPSTAEDGVKGQWRQEQIVYHLAELVRAYPNAAFYMMWEAHDTGSHVWGDCATTPEFMQAWHEHMARLIHSISPDTLITTGEIGRTGPLYPDFAFASCQAPNLDWWADKNFAVVTTGWPMRDLDGNVCLCTTAACDADTRSCLPTEDPNIFPRARTYLRDGWLLGIQMGAPYNEYRYADVAAAMDPYIVSLRPALDGIVTWEDEPGAELVESMLPSP